MNDAPMRDALKEEARALPCILMIGIALNWGGGAIEAARGLHEEMTLPRPWINPVIEVRPNPQGKPSIFYDPQPVADLTGTWKAAIVVEGVRCCTTEGRGQYSDNKWPKFWDWGDWLGRDWPVPTRPFQLCVQYDLTTAHGARGQFGPFCSETFIPESQL